MFKKFNWGHGIALFIFIFILSVFYRIWLSNQYDINLVTDDYYPKGIIYQKEIDKQNRAKNFAEFVKVVQNTDTISLFIPIEYTNKLDSGKVYFYRPSGAASDKLYELQPDTLGMQTFDAKELKSGRYTVKLDWSNAGVSYYVEKDLFITK